MLSFTLFNIIIDLIGYNHVNGITFDDIFSPTMHIWLAVVVGPILETLLSTTLAVEVAMYYKKPYRYIIIAASIVLFGMAHNFDPLYPYLAGIMGFFFTTFYIISRQKFNMNILQATLYTSLFHGLHNGLIFLYDGLEYMTDHMV